MNVLYVRVVEVEVLELAGVIWSRGVFTEFVVDGDRLEIIIEITIWVFSHPLRKSRGIIELRDEKMETFALQIVGNVIWGVEVEMSGFVKLEGFVEFLS